MSAASEAAHAAVSYAIRTGHLVRPSHCSVCGAADRKGIDRVRTTIHGHHADYERKLDVEWWCASCHVTHHQYDDATIGVRRALRDRGFLFLDDARDDARIDRGDCTIVEDRAYSFADAWRCRVEEPEKAVRQCVVFTRSVDAEVRQKPLFAKPHPPAEVLRAERLAYQREALRDGIERAKRARQILTTWAALNGVEPPLRQASARSIAKNNKRAYPFVVVNGEQVETRALAVRLGCTPMRIAAHVRHGSLDRLLGKAA